MGLLRYVDNFVALGLGKVGYKTLEQVRNERIDARVKMSREATDQDSLNLILGRPEVQAQGNYTGMAADAAAVGNSVADAHAGIRALHNRQGVFEAESTRREDARRADNATRQNTHEIQVLGELERRRAEQQSFEAREAEGRIAYQKVLNRRYTDFETAEEQRRLAGLKVVREEGQKDLETAKEQITKNYEATFDRQAQAFAVQLGARDRQFGEHLRGNEDYKRRTDAELVDLKRKLDESTAESRRAWVLARSRAGAGGS